MELYLKSGGRFRRADKDEILAAAAQYAVAALTNESITAPAEVRNLVVKYLGPRDSEVFCAFWLTSRHQILGFEELFQGTIDGAQVYPRELVKKALARNAAAVVLCHNHPSGEPEPSAADQIITQRIREALELIQVRVLDHVIVGGEKAVSFAERGLL